MPRQDFCGLYYAECVVNNKRLVGSSIRVFARMDSHIKLLRNDEHYNPYLQNSWNKHGGDNFIWNMLELCSEDIRYKREQHWIEFLESYKEDFGYNIAFPVRSLLPSPRMSEIHKALWRNMLEEELQARLIQSRAALAYAHALWKTPEGHARFAAIVTENISVAHARWHNDSEYRARKTQWLLDASAKASEKWANDPEFREVHTARLAGQAKAASDANAKRLAEDPAYREKFNARMRRQSQEISVRRRGKKRAAHGEKMKGKWADPEYRARVTEAIREGRRRALDKK